MADDQPDRRFDPGSLLMGLWFAVAGLAGTAIGADGLDGAVTAAIPISFAVAGVGLIVPKRRR